MEAHQAGWDALARGDKAAFFRAKLAKLREAIGDAQLRKALLRRGVAGEEDAFLRMISENPNYPLPRLVFADWLEEAGDVLERISSASTPNWKRFRKGIDDERKSSPKGTPTSPNGLQILPKVHRAAATPNLF